MGQILEDYFEANRCSHEQSFLIATQKLQAYTQYGFKYLRRERPLQGMPRLKTWSWLKSHMEVRFYRDLLFDEEIKKERPIIAHKDIKDQ